ncbi:MAG: hypothetical protein WAO83_16020 [Fuerstiella sp.]
MYLIVTAIIQYLDCWRNRVGSPFAHTESALTATGWHDSQKSKTFAAKGQTDFPALQQVKKAQRKSGFIKLNDSAPVVISKEKRFVEGGRLKPESITAPSRVQLRGKSNAGANQLGQDSHKTIDILLPYHSRDDLAHE